MKLLVKASSGSAPPRLNVPTHTRTSIGSVYRKRHARILCPAGDDEYITRAAVTAAITPWAPLSKRYTPRACVVVASYLA